MDTVGFANGSPNWPAGSVSMVLLWTVLIGLIVLRIIHQVFHADQVIY